MRSNWTKFDYSVSFGELLCNHWPVCCDGHLRCWDIFFRFDNFVHELLIGHISARCGPRIVLELWGGVLLCINGSQCCVGIVFFRLLLRIKRLHMHRVCCRQLL